MPHSYSNEIGKTEMVENDKMDSRDSKANNLGEAERSSR